MFLKFLNEREKIIFMKLAVAIIHADGKLEESEKQMMAEYSQEMGITLCNLDEQINLQEITDLAKEIGSNSTDSVKRIFLLELLACANSDNDFANEEKTLMKSFLNAFDLTETDFNTCLKLLKEYLKITSTLANFVKGEI